MAAKRFAICGFSGRMGSAIRNMQSEFSGEVEFVDFREANSQSVSAVIDFSNPEAFEEVMEFCRSRTVPLVSGTTGLSDGQKAEIKTLAETVPVLWDANMSLGIQWLLSALEKVATLPGDFNIQVEETHHKHKKDAPSGTAIEIQKVLQANRRENLPEPLSIRGGGVFGQHKVIMMGEEEVIVFDHNVLSRKVFARGALTAALWLIGQPSGFYRMRDLFNAGPSV